jgi:general secretion pathway protein E
MAMDEPLRRLILKTSDSNSINDLAVQRGMINLVRDGANKVLSGMTTVEEVLRVTRILKREMDADIEA